MQKTDNLRAWSLLQACVRSGSLSKAADAESLDLSVASRLMEGLEAEIGLALLDRSTKPAAVTELARRLGPYASKMVKARRDALALCGQFRREAQGMRQTRTIRLSLPINLSRASLIQSVLAFEDRHKDVRIEFSADSGLPALLAARTDVSLGSYYRQMEGLFEIPAGKSYSFIMGTQRYARRCGLPRRIEDLRDHTVLLRYTQNLAYSNKLENGQETYYIDQGHRVRHGDAAACREMLLAGQGLAVDLSPGFVSEYLSDGTVFPVLRGWHREPWCYHVYCRACCMNDPLVRELMADVRDALFATFTSQWKFWYRQFGLPMPLSESGA